MVGWEAEATIQHNANSIQTIYNTIQAQYKQYTNSTTKALTIANSTVSTNNSELLWETYIIQNYKVRKLIKLT